MPEIPTNANAVQGELFPSDKSQRALDGKDLVQDHIRQQDRIWRAIYSQCATKIINAQKQNLELSVAELKQLGDTMRNAGTWSKQALEQLQLAEQSAIEALAANSGNYLNDLSEMPKEELESLIKEWL